MLIAQISDTHIAEPDPGEPHTLERISMLQDFVTSIGEMSVKPDLILHTGDISQDGKPEEYDIVKSMLGSIDIPVFFALGNRDLAANLVQGLKGFVQTKLVDDFLIYSIDSFPVRLIAMDTQKRNSRIGTACSARLRILEDLLDQKPDIPTALFMHHPPFEVPTSKYPFQFDDPVLADAFLQLIARYKQVVHLFCGHMHREFSVKLPNCNASVAPSLSPSNRLGDYKAAWKERPLFQLHRWNPDMLQFETSLASAGSR